MRWALVLFGREVVAVEFSFAGDLEDGRSLYVGTPGDLTVPDIVCS